jgi:hypothetical protein
MCRMTGYFTISVSAALGTAMKDAAIAVAEAGGIWLSRCLGGGEGVTEYTSLPPIVIEWLKFRGRKLSCHK